MKGIDNSDQVFDTDRSSENGAWAVRGTSDGLNKIRAPEKEFKGKRDCAGDTSFVP